MTSAYNTENIYQDTHMNIEVHMPKSLNKKTRQKHCFILHGWDLGDHIKLPFPLNLLINPRKSKAQQIRSIHDALRSTLRRNGYIVWEITYNSEWPFPIAADFILGQLKYLNYDFGHSILIGYSTGGLVARSMVSKGFPFYSLITLATPHTGLLKYIEPAFSIPSVSAMLRGSKELTYLNNSDEHLRHMYNFWGMTFNGHVFGLDYHDDDGLVHIDSALGTLLTVRPKYSKEIYLLKRDGTNLNDLVHNHEVLDAKHIMLFIDCCDTILNG